MNAMETVNAVLDELYDEFDAIIKSNKNLYYNAKVFKQPPNTPIIPNIQIKSIGYPHDENLSKEEEKWNLMIEMNIYAQDTGEHKKRVIARELQEKAYDFYCNTKGFKCNFNNSVFNLDANVERLQLRFRATYDLNTGILYRN